MHLLTQQEILLGKGTWVESSRVREPRRTALPHGLQSRVLWWWDYFPGCPWPIILTQSPSWWCTSYSAKMDAREDSGRWLDMWYLLLTFPELFRWLISSVFLSRTSCRKTTHANGYYGAWPGWAVSIHVLPKTVASMYLAPKSWFPYHSPINRAKPPWENSWFYVSLLLLLIVLCYFFALILWFAWFLIPRR